MRTASADLHVHTTHSDGLHRPEEVVELAAQAGLSWIGVTDHDSVSGLPEAEEAAGRFGIGLVPGLELSVPWQGQDLHLLAYWIDPSDRELLDLLAEVRAARTERAGKILGKLRRLGVDLPFEALQHGSDSGRALGRPHIARALLACGCVGSFGEAFARYLGSEAPAYEPKRPVDLGRALGVLRGAGGIPVLAHPGAYRLNGTMEILVEHGLEGLETEYPKRSADEGAGLRRLAGSLCLATTGGSDFHGAGISDVMIGAVRIDARAVDLLAARKEGKR